LPVPVGPISRMLLLVSFDGVDRNRRHFAEVRINRHGQRALGLFLADDVFVKLATISLGLSAIPVHSTNAR
jgi:hypothetical protein